MRHREGWGFESPISTIRRTVYFAYMLRSGSAARCYIASRPNETANEGTIC